MTGLVVMRRNLILEFEEKLWSLRDDKPALDAFMAEIKVQSRLGKITTEGGYGWSISMNVPSVVIFPRRLWTLISAINASSAGLPYDERLPPPKMQIPAQDRGVG
jgi:hypothetical protein